MVAFFRPLNIQAFLPSRQAPFWLSKVIITLLALVFLWGGIVLNLIQNHRNTEREAYTDTRNLTRAIEENLARTIEAVDQQLLRLRELYIRDHTLFERTVTGPARDLLPSLTLQVGIIDRSGALQFTSLGPITAPLDLSDREHFRAHLPDSADFLFISKPVLGRVSNSWVLQFSRKILDIDGRFDGVIVASFDPQWLSRFHASLDLGPSSFFIVGLDGVLRTSAPSVDDVGKDLSGSRLFDEAKRQKQGGFRGQAVPGSPESFISYRTLSEFPLIVAVGLEADAVFMSYRKNVWRQVSAGIILTLIVLVVSGTLIRHTRDQQDARDMIHEMIESAPVAVIGLTRDLYVTIWNRGAERMFGYNAPELLGQPYPINSSAERERAQARFNQLERGEKINETKSVWKHKDGHLIDVRFSGSLFRNFDENRTSYLFMIEDMTERERSAAIISEQRAFLRKVIDINPNFIFVKDREGRFTLANQAVADVYGTTVEDLIGKADQDFNTNQEEVEHFYRDDLAVINGLQEKVIPEEKITDASGKDRWLQTVKRPILNALGQADMILGVSVDITEQRQMMEALRLSEERFRVAFDTAGIGISWTDLEGRFIKVNNSYCRLMGYSEAELLTRNSWDISHPDDMIDTADYMGKSIAGRINAFTVQKRYIRKNGDIIWTAVNVSVVCDAAGAPLHFIAQVQDVTAQRKAEDQLRQAQKMQAVGQLTAGIAHDFNNILGAVIGNLDLTSQQLTNDATEARHFIEEAIDAAVSGAEIVKRLLAFSRQQPLLSKPTDLKEVIVGMVPLLRPSLGASIEIKTEIPADLWTAMADTAQVESALLNLALNARDAMPEGGVISLDAANVQVNGAPFYADDNLKAGDYVVIAVTDSGSGMAPGVLEHAFEPFFTTKGVGAGSGLGLSMVLGTMQQLGGSARIYSEPGQGTTVRLFLPRAMTAGETAAQKTAPEAPATGVERVLMVEDNALIRNSVAVMIKGLGYRVDVVENADEALALWDSGERFDLVFSDIIMPGQLNGVGLARALRARDPRIKILLTSGFANPAAIQGDMTDLGLNLLQKPYRLADLAVHLRAALDGKAS